MGVDFDAVVSRRGGAHDAPVLSENVSVRVGPELVQELRRPSMSVKRKVTVPEGISRPMAR